MKNRASALPMVEVRHSPVHGHGVFALRRIRKGTTIMEYLGDRVSHEEADSRYENKDPNDNHTFLFTVDSKTVIDGGVDGNDARFINHGCDPNCESASQNKRIYVEARRTIQPGEELAYDYQIQRDPEDPPNVDEIFACRCGAANCRGSMLVAMKKPAKKKKAKKKKAIARASTSYAKKSAKKTLGKSKSAKKTSAKNKSASQKSAKQKSANQKSALRKSAQKKSLQRKSLQRKSSQRKSLQRKSAQRKSALTSRRRGR